MKVAQMLKQYIEASGLKKGFVAERSGMTIDTLSAILNDRRGLSADELVTICEKGLNIKTSSFFAYKFQKIENEDAKTSA